MSLDLSKEQVNGGIDIVGLDVPNNTVEEVPYLLVVSGSQKALLLHCRGDDR